MKILVYSVLLLGLSMSCSADEKDATLTQKPIQVTVNQPESNSEGAFATASGKLVSKNSVNVSTRTVSYTHLDVYKRQLIYIQNKTSRIRGFWFFII